MTLTGLHLIGGRWQASQQRFDATNPATGQTLTPGFSEATKPQADSAVEEAAKAFEAMLQHPDPRWPAALLDRVAGNIMELGDALLERAEAETALPRPRLVGERARTVGQLKMFADFVRDGSWVDATIDTADPNRQPMPKPDVRRMLRPRGPVVVFGASNFPFAFSTLGGDTASALAGGNPVIIKGHPSHPGTSEMFASAILGALESLDLPRGLFGLLQGRSYELSGWLVQHPAITAVGFTGSQKAGRALFDLAAKRPTPIPVYAEMGSLNPLVLTPAAIKERGEAIAKDLAGSILLGGGQFCTKPGLVLVPADAKPFVDSLSKNLAAASPVTMLNRGLRDSFLARVKEWSHVPGVTARATSAASGYASVSPSLFQTSSDTFLREPRLREEAFGPAALVVEFKDVDDARRIVESVGGSLTGTVHTGSTDNVSPLLHALETVVGRLIINGYPTGVEVTHAMVHGGPYPATTDPNSTSVGTAAIKRFVRMVAYQNVPDELLPAALKNGNPLAIVRMVNGKATREGV
jgi:alpha-ketoglutaric semialdehyde dehydrogenase